MSQLQLRVRHTYPGGFRLEVAFASDQPTTALFGPSGAGKSSLLMAIAGLLRPDEGRIVWGDRVLFDRRAGIWVPPEERRMGVVFQDQRLFPHLRVEGNLRYGERRRRPGARRLAFQRIVEVLDLRHLLERWPATLSGGERQRLALGRALMAGPEVLLLDEPVAAVDEERRWSILRYIERVIHEWDIPTVYVSHHRAEVQRLADWVVVLEAGSVVAEGPVEEILVASSAGALVGEPLNLLRLEDPVLGEDGRWRAALPGSGGAVSIRLPSAPAAPGRTLHVQFTPRDVVLARGQVARLSARNRLPGRVREVVARAGRVMVAVEVAGQVVWAEVTPEAVAELELSRGEAVTCLMKTAALEVLG